MTDKQILKERFERLYKGKRLLAIQLNGFTHAVFYDEKEEGAPVDDYKVDHYSGCMSGEESRGYGMNDDKVVALFIGYPNYQYQNNAQEIVYVMP